jgi:endonuclease/exonuclease/phosphatase family metal-dependent hydrolase
MRKTILYIFLFILFIPLNSSGGDDEVVRVMTYNIRYAGDEKVDGINAWSNRRELVASVIRFHRADIIGLQEALAHQLEDLTDLLSGYTWIGVGRDDGKTGGEFSAILIKKERIEIVDNSSLWLSETPDKPSKGWDADFNRIVSWAKMQDRRTDTEFYVFNTHFDHRGEQARLNSVALLKEMIAGIATDYPVIVTGDFNFTPESEAYRLLTNEGEHILADAHKISRYGHYGSDITFNDFGRSLITGNKIDYIFIKNNVDVIQHGIIAETFNGRFPSDHMPVLAEVVIGNR